jgi:hypothetical protein
MTAMINNTHTGVKGEATANRPAQGLGRSLIPSYGNAPSIHDSEAMVKTFSNKVDQFKTHHLRCVLNWAGSEQLAAVMVPVTQFLAFLRKSFSKNTFSTCRPQYPVLLLRHPL